MNSLPRLLKRDGRVDDESWKKAINYCFEGNEGGMDERNKSRSSGGKFNSPPRFMPRSWQQPFFLSLSRGYIAGDLQPKFAPPERSIRVFTGRAPTKEPRRPNFMKHGAVYRERSGRESNTNSRFCTSLSLSLSLSLSFSVISFAHRVTNY